MTKRIGIARLEFLILYDSSARSQVLMFADRAMAFGSLIIGSVAATLCLVFVTWVVSAEELLWSPVAIAACFGALTSLGQVVVTIAAMVRPRLPTAIQVALMQPHWPAGVRWIFATWWLIHLLGGAALAINIVEAGIPDLFFIVFAFTFSMAFSYAAYGFLMLAVTCYTRRADVITRVWSWRVICSYIHGLAILTLGIVRFLAG
ncbi:MAG: hypothetical protein H0T51_02715 [Pirellulales bacterium]|nr:hypothetical protein [Pirellulales bacterium]